MPVAPRLAMKARNLPLGCHDQGIWSSGLSVSRVTSPVPSAFTQYKLQTPALARSDANTMRRPSGVQTGMRSWPGSKVNCVSVSRAHSYTQMSRCLPSEISIASFWPSGENRGFAQSAFVARSTDVLPSRVIQSIGCGRRRGRAGHVHERAVRGHGQLRAAGDARIRGDALERRHRRADRLEAIEIEAHREERALVHVDQVAALGT